MHISQSETEKLYSQNTFEKMPKFNTLPSNTRQTYASFKERTVDAASHQSFCKARQCFSIITALGSVDYMTQECETTTWFVDSLVV